jgi:DNA-binding MarR family transcriptional regulator
MVDRSPDVTRLIDRLEKAGLVERDRTDEDRRLSIARITAKGLHLLDQIAPDFEKLYRYLGGLLSQPELQELSRLCERLYGKEPLGLEKDSDDGEASGVKTDDEALEQIR